MGFERSRGGMGDILSHDNNLPAPSSQRQSGAMGSILSHEGAAAGSPTQGSQRANIAPYSTSGMNEVMQGVGSLGVDDHQYGIGRRQQYQQMQGTGALSALRGEEAEPGMDDPFVGNRRPKLHARDLGAEVRAPTGGLPGTEDRATRAAEAALAAREQAGGGGASAGAMDPMYEQLHALYRSMLDVAGRLPRDPPEDPRMARGRLSDYRPLLAHLNERGLKLNADAAGTLVAMIDVEGQCSFDEFMECVAMSMQADGPSQAAAPPPPPPPPPNPSRCARGRVRRPSTTPGGSWAKRAPCPPSPRILIRANCSLLSGQTSNRWRRRIWARC